MQILMYKFKPHHKELIFGFSALAIFIVLIIYGIYFYKSSQAGSWTFTQTDWSGGSATTTAVDPTNQSNWTNFSTSSNISVAGDVILASQGAIASGRTDLTTSTSFDSQYPSIAVSSSGVIHIVYASKEYVSSTYNIVYRNSNNWSNKVYITTSTSLNSYRPSIAVVSSGTVYIAYYSNEYNATHTNIAYRNSNNWFNRVDITTSTSWNASNVSTAVASSGVVHVAYTSIQDEAEYNQLFYVNSNNWSQKTSVVGGYVSITSDSIAVALSGVVHIAYHDSLSNLIYYRNSNNWSQLTQLSETSIQSAYPLIAVDSSGVAHVAYYSSENNASKNNIVYRNSSSGSERIDVTSATSVTSQSPSITVDSANGIHISYQSGEYSSTIIQNIAYRNSNNWSNRIDITTSTANSSYAP